MVASESFEEVQLPLPGFKPFGRPACSLVAVPILLPGSLFFDCICNYQLLKDSVALIQLGGVHCVGFM
jgi:hypothetical protein